MTYADGPAESQPKKDERNDPNDPASHPLPTQMITAGDS